MRNKNTLLLAAVSAFALMMMTTATANAAYQCTWSDGIKVCGNELGFAPSAGGESDRRDQHSGDHDSGSADASGGSGGSGSSGSSGGEGGEGVEGGDGDDGNGKGNNGKGNGGDDGSPNGKDDNDR